MVFSFMSLAGLTSGCKRVENHVHSRACWTLDRNCGHFTSKCVRENNLFESTLISQYSVLSVTPMTK